MPSDGPTILRPTPRRPFDINVINATPPELLTPIDPGDQSYAAQLETKAHGNGGTDSFSRTRSILNLTSSTLFGIYSPTGTGYTEREEPSTPWGIGAETPSNRGSIDGGQPVFASQTDRPPLRGKSSLHVPTTPLPSFILNVALRTVLLFAIGMGYGMVVTHLHNDQKLAAVQVEGIIKPSYSWSYLVFWGVAGVGVGSLLPWVDTVWEEPTPSTDSSTEKERPRAAEDEDAIIPDSGFAADWNPVVRIIGAFVGIAFAIRKLPWASTLQAAVTLALVNPVLWYLIDRSKPGFLLSAAVGLLGTTVLLSLSPEMMPSPAPSPHAASSLNATHLFANQALYGLMTQETVEVGTWIISVLFCSCVCFGNIGRRLALRKASSRPEKRSSSFM